MDLTQDPKRHAKQLLEIASQLREKHWGECCRHMLLCIAGGRPQEAHRWLDRWLEENKLKPVTLVSSVYSLEQYGLGEITCHSLVNTGYTTIRLLIESSDRELRKVPDMTVLRLASIDQALELAGWQRVCRQNPSEQI